MSQNNNLLYNAAIAGYLEGAMEGRIPWSATAASYAAFVTEATNFGIEFDAAVPNDALISAGGGGALPPTTAAITDAQMSKCAAARAAAFAVSSGRSSTGDSAASFASLAANAAALYTQLIGAFALA